MEIGEYRVIPKKTKFWSIALQEQISMENDAIFKITNTVYNSDTYCYGTLQLSLFNLPGQIPSLQDKNNGDIGINITKTEKYESF